MWYTCFYYTFDYFLILNEIIQFKTKLIILPRAYFIYLHAYSFFKIRNYWLTPQHWHTQKFGALAVTSKGKWTGWRRCRGMQCDLLLLEHCDLLLPQAQDCLGSLLYSTEFSSSPITDVLIRCRIGPCNWIC